MRTLTADQRARRSAVMLDVARYRDRGVFPHNDEFPGRAIPYLVDRTTGTLSAGANLLAYTGVTLRL